MTLDQAAALMGVTTRQTRRILAAYQEQGASCWTPDSPARGEGVPKHRVRRQRMPREGMLIQMDGSHHRGWGIRHHRSRC